MNTTHHRPRGMHEPEKIHSANWQMWNSFACQVCGIKPTEQDWIDADLANSANKTERHDAAALKDQINYLNKTEAA
jgi:hypothetical protein